MDEFAFGTLSTVEKRVARLRERRGVHHHDLLSPRAPRAGETPLVTVTVELDKAIDRVVGTVREPAAATFTLHCVRTDWDLLNWSYFQTWQTRLPGHPAGTLVRYVVEAYPVDGSEPIPADNGATFSYVVGDPAPPAWAESAVVYQIFPDRFYPGDGRSWNQVKSLNDVYGGTLRGIIDKLDYIVGMGFNCIWLNPFFPDDTHHGYHATDYFAVNPRLGTMDDIRELVSKAQDKGIRLLLDFVANHWGSRHETFQAAVADRDSEYYDWYLWEKWPHQYKTFFKVKDLPQLNVDHPGVRDYLLRSVRFWLGEVGFDGLRLDYALGPNHDFWTELRALVREIRPDAWLFGEVVDTPATQLSYEGRFHGCLDFLLAQALRDTFAMGRMDLATFDNFLTQHEQFFPSTFSRPSFLDNHDMNRFLWLAGNDKRKLKVAALCHFTLSGAPIVYNGTEVGVSQECGMFEYGSQGMAECRQPMAWGEEQDKELLAFFKWLIHFRRQHPVLWRGRRRTLHLDEAAGTYAYSRSDDHETILAALNVSEETRTVTVSDEAGSLSHTFILDPWSGDIFVSGNG
ncbi:MAG TPA: alpha-amylase family glycosyl hydrolase [Anaerolineae bacterium]